MLSLAFALCPCLVCAEMAAEDCCASDGPSIAGMCCANNDSGSRMVVPSATVLAFAPGLAPAHPMAIDAVALAPVFMHSIPTRPIAARAVLRI